MTHPPGAGAYLVRCFPRIFNHPTPFRQPTKRHLHCVLSHHALPEIDSTPDVHEAAQACQCGGVTASFKNHIGLDATKPAHLFLFSALPCATCFATETAHPFARHPYPRLVLRICPPHVVLVAPTATGTPVLGLMGAVDRDKDSSHRHQLTTTAVVVTATTILKALLFVAQPGRLRLRPVYHIFLGTDRVAGPVTHHLVMASRPQHGQHVNAQVSATAAVVATTGVIL